MVSKFGKGANTQTNKHTHITKIVSLTILSNKEIFLISYNTLILINWFIITELDYIITWELSIHHITPYTVIQILLYNAWELHQSELYFITRLM